MIDGLTTSLVFATQCHDFVETWLCLAHFCQFEASALAVGAPVLFSVWHQSAEGMQYRAAVIWRCIGDRETATWPVTVFFFGGGGIATQIWGSWWVWVVAKSLKLVHAPKMVQTCADWKVKSSWQHEVFRACLRGEVEAKEPKHPLPLRIHHSNIRHCDVRPWCWQDQTNKSNHILSNLNKSHATTCVWIQYVYIFIDP